MNVEKGDIVIDAGVAEGNFALDVIDDVSKIYLIEADKEWIEALKETFKEYADKVVFVNKFLTDSNTEDSVSLDALIGNENINYIKMDIEGEEVKALYGAYNVLKRNNKLRLDICAYHNIEDEQLIKEHLSKLAFRISVSDGYMFFVDDDVYESKEPRLVRGLVHAVKE
jgi:16S rRNA C1402 N4-methylase RsmH